MIRSFLIILFAMTLSHTQAQDLPETIHGFQFTSLEGEKIDLSQYKGKKILIVNTASKCGYTPQYEGLEKLYSENKDHLVIIGFPDRKSTRLNSSHVSISYAVFCLKKKTKHKKWMERTATG